jgi:flagellar biosynthesis chaperone FliJ
MARVQERKAAKDYPQNGIKKGDTYFYVKIKTGPYSSRTIRSLQRPKRYQLTGSEFYSQLWQIEDDAFAGVNEASDLREIAEQLRELGQEQQDKFDNMPEGLQQGDTGMMLEERASSCEVWADDIDSTADELEAALEEFDAAIEPWAAYNAARDEYDDLDEEDQEGAVEPQEPDAELPDVLDGVDLSDEDAVAAARNELIAEKAQEAQDANPGIN